MIIFYYFKYLNISVLNIEEYLLDIFDLTRLNQFLHEVKIMLIKNMQVLIASGQN